MILYYDIERPVAGGWAEYKQACLCDRHVTNRKALGWSVGHGIEVDADRDCDDCEDAKEPTILDRVIEDGDRERDAGEPDPVRVLPGQRRLF